TTTRRSGAGPRSSSVPAALSVCGCATRSPRAAAASLTGDAVTWRPRPAGRSGCVNTRFTSAPDAASASSVGTANCGVPANAIVAETLTGSAVYGRGSDHGHGLRLSRGGAFGPGALGLLHRLLLQSLAFELRQVVDEQLPLEMIHLVLDADREEPLGLELERLAVAVERADFDLRSAIDVVVELGHGQAAFLGIRRAFGAQDLGVDQAMRLRSVRRDVADQDPLVNIDLGRGQTDARRGIHGLEQILDKAPDIGVDFCDRFGANSQPRVRILEYWETCHCR